MIATIATQPILKQANENHIPRSAFPRRQSGWTRTWSRTARIIVEQDHTTGICVYSWYPRALLTDDSLLQYPRDQRHLLHHSVHIGAFLPGHGMFLTDSPDLLPACQKDIARYFPRGVRVPAAEIETIDRAFAHRNLFLEWDLLDREDGA